ncbi:MAG TPA: stage II sporulation protein M [Acidobacteriaceae bacterium]|nr:stage II sporulation protein M [Acidobacteriaceae bacterium]
MISNRWIEQRQNSWSRLDALTRQVEAAGLRVLTGTELREFGLLYRQIAADLSAVRTDRAAGTLEAYLNGLLSRAHNRIYSGRKTGFGTVARFMWQEYPRIFRKQFRYVLVSFLLFAVGLGLGTLLTLARPEFMHLFLGPQMVSTIEHHKMWTQSIVGMKPQASSAIMTNNIGVSFMAFAGGITAGIFTIYLEFFNGLQIGIIGTACAQAHMLKDLLNFVAAHSALELPSIFIAGGAGLRIAAGLLFPGVLKRKDSLALAAREAVRLLAGVVPLLVMAGLLEAFLSPSGAPFGVKLAVGGTLFTGLCFWLAEGGRGAGRTAHAASPPS